MKNGKSCSLSNTKDRNAKITKASAVTPKNTCKSWKVIVLTAFAIVSLFILIHYPMYESGVCF